MLVEDDDPQYLPPLKANEGITDINYQPTLSRTYVTASINGVSFDAMLDSGAQMTIMSESLANRCIQPEQREETDVIPVNVSDEPIDTLGMTRPVLTVGAYSAPYKIYIAKDGEINGDFLLGDEWMRALHKYTFEYENGVKKIKINGIPIRSKSELVNATPPP